MLTVIVAVLLLAPAVYSQGTPSSSCKAPTYLAYNGGVTVQGGTNVTSTSPLSDTCKANATADLDTRTKATQWGVTSKGGVCFTGTWGPYASTSSFKTPFAASGCNIADWARHRIIQFGHYVVNQDYNYCHHHVPSWAPPTTAGYRVNCTNCPTCSGCTSTAGCTCNEAGLSNKLPWQGVDCSNLSMFLYNIAFGALFTSNIDSQACNPTGAPGRLLSTTIDEALFRPGDLLFITSCSTCQDVSHVALWTGYTVDYTNTTLWRSPDYLLNNTSPCSRTNAASYMRSQNAAGLPTYLILDSTYNGPKFRAFAGWYRTSFSHARRVISPSTALPVTNSTVFRYTTTDTTCRNLLKGTTAAAVSATTSTARTTSVAAGPALVEFWADRGPREASSVGPTGRLLKSAAAAAPQ